MMFFFTSLCVSVTRSVTSQFIFKTSAFSNEFPSGVSCQTIRGCFVKHVRVSGSHCKFEGETANYITPALEYVKIGIFIDISVTSWQNL